MYSNIIPFASRIATRRLASNTTQFPFSVKSELSSLTRMPRDKLIRLSQQISDITLYGLSDDDLYIMIQKSIELEKTTLSKRKEQQDPEPIRFARASKFRDELLPVSGNNVSDANTLALFSIIKRRPDTVADELRGYAKITSSTSLSDFEKATDGIVSAYPTSSIHTCNRVTLQWLRDPSLELIPEEIKKLYEAFIEPKLFKSGKLVEPGDFVQQKIITGSYSNRRADMLMAVMHDKITEAGGNPKEYLSKVYVLSLTANPYNWRKNWGNGNKTLKNVLNTTPSDMFYSAWDCLTRPPTEIARFLQQSTYEHTNIQELDGTQRTLRILNPRSENNFYGHNVVPLIDAVKSAYPEYCYEGLLPFFRGDLSFSQLDELRRYGATKYNSNEPKQFTGKPNPITNLYPAQQVRNSLVTHRIADEISMSPEQEKYTYDPNNHIPMFGSGGIPAKPAER